MKHPNVPIHESRFRRVGCLPALRLTVILAAAVLTAPLAVADSSPLANNHTRSATPGTSSTDSPEIAALKQRVADLQRQLGALMAQIRALKDQEPQDPGSKGTEDARKKYQIAHASWQKQVDNVQQQIVFLSQLLAQAQHQLQALQLKAGQSGH
jgi:uncharacterized protein YceH (UPF0502 family)